MTTYTTGWTFLLISCINVRKLTSDMCGAMTILYPFSGAVSHMFACMASLVHKCCFPFNKLHFALVDNIFSTLFMLFQVLKNSHYNDKPLLQSLLLLLNITVAIKRQYNKPQFHLNNKTSHLFIWAASSRLCMKGNSNTTNVIYSYVWLLYIYTGSIPLNIKGLAVV